MSAQTTVFYQPENGSEPVHVPISYVVEQDGNNRTFRIEILMPEKERPKWLRQSNFIATEHYSPGEGSLPGVTATDYNHQRFSSAEEGNFLVAAIAQIKAREVIG